MNSSMHGSSSAPVTPREPISLFNGRDLSGWISDIPARDQDPNAPEMFVVRDGVLVTPGDSVGHLVSETNFKDFRLEIDYRLPPEGGGGSILVHVSRLRVLRTKSKNIFPQSLDIKIRHKDAGDIYCIAENIDAPDPARRPREPGQAIGGADGDARHIMKGTDAEKPLTEWNTMIVECRGRSVKIWLNGNLVNEGTNCTTDHGRIALQATEQVVEFRRVELLPLTE